jgi:hypothetical protein
MACQPSSKGQGWHFYKQMPLKLRVFLPHLVDDWVSRVNQSNHPGGGSCLSPNAICNLELLQ